MPIDKTKPANTGTTVSPNSGDTSTPAALSKEVRDPTETARLADGELTRVIAGRAVLVPSDEEITSELFWGRAHWAPSDLSAARDSLLWIRRWKVEVPYPAHPELLINILTILESPESIPIETEDARIKAIAGRMTAHVAERWAESHRPLHPDECRRIDELFEVRLAAAGTLCPSFVDALDYCLSHDNIIRSAGSASIFPQSSSSPEETALTYLWGFMNHYARWEMKGLRGDANFPRHEIPSFEWNKREIPGLFTTLNLGYISLEGGMIMSLWWQGNHSLRGEKSEAPVLLCRVGYIWTPKGYIIEQVQGGHNLR